MKNDINVILHPTDFSEAAHNAFTYAREIARKVNAKIRVTHSVNVPYSYGTDRMMQEFISKKNLSISDIETTVEAGDPVSNILASRGDLIIIGAKGKSNLATILYGSISTNIILKSSVPVLVVPLSRKYSDFNHFTFATDYREGDLEALEEIVKWAELFDNADITVFHTSSDNSLDTKIKYRGFRELITESFDYPRINFQLTIDKNFASGISTYLDKQDTDVIVMTRHKKTFLQSLMQSNHIKQTSYSEVPLLVLPERKKYKLTTE